MTASVSVVVVSHEVSWTTPLASWACSRNFVAFSLVHCVDAFFFFVFLFSFSFLCFLCWRCFCWAVAAAGFASSFLAAERLLSLEVLVLLVPLCGRLFLRFFWWTVTFADVFGFNDFCLINGFVNVSYSDW